MFTKLTVCLTAVQHLKNVDVIFLDGVVLMNEEDAFGRKGTGVLRQFLFAKVSTGM